MSLHPCPDCGHQVAVRAESCPQCGSFFQSFRHGQQIDRAGWTTTIAYGVLLGSILTVLIAGVGIIALMAFVSASLTPHLPLNR